MSLKKSKEGYMVEFEGRKWKGENVIKLQSQKLIKERYITIMCHFCKWNMYVYYMHIICILHVHAYVYVNLYKKKNLQEKSS